MVVVDSEENDSLIESTVCEMDFVMELVTDLARRPRGRGNCGGGGGGGAIRGEWEGGSEKEGDRQTDHDRRC